jgi:sulfide:quinone oxidoreductase
MTATSQDRPLEVLIAGAGVAGLETFLALHDLARDRVRLTLLDPSDAFVFRPMTVAQPFSVGHAGRYPLADLVHGTTGRHVRSTLASVDPETHIVRTGDGQELPYDVLVLAHGAVAAPAYDRALTFDPDDTDQLSGLLRDAEDGYAKRIAVVVPPEPHWTLPAYELALLLARDIRGMGMDDVEITLVTPEDAPLALFGRTASEAVAQRLEAAGITTKLTAYAELRPGHPTTVVLHPSEESFETDHVLALPVIRPREIAGMPRGRDGFLDVDQHGRVKGVDDVYAAGDGTAFPVKQGGLAAQQADAVVHHIAARAGAAVEAKPFVPVLRGRLLTGEGDLWMREHLAGGAGEGEIAEHCLWWPPSKVAGQWLAPYLAAVDDAAKGFAHPPSTGHAVELHLDDSGSVPVPRNLELLGHEG